jgi:hypothetical protein
MLVKWIKRFGVVGFAFFLLKGLVWLAIAGALAAGGVGWGVAIGTLEDWKQVVDCPELVAAAADVAPGDLAGIARLRRNLDAGIVAVAVELAEARRRAAAKFGARADSIVADVQGMEMATATAAGAHKARRFASAGLAVTDLCCGIGGDAMALMDAGVDVVGVDASDVRAWMCARNAGCETRVADASEVEVREAYHLDPARRTGAGVRRWRYEDLEPGRELIERLAERDGAVKLGPGVDLDVLPRGEIELISERGTLTQAVLWTGSLAGVSRRATVLPAGASLAGEPVSMAFGEAGTYVFSVDASVERAGLMGLLARELGLVALHPSLGLLTGNELVESPFLTPFRLIERMGWREKKVREWLRANDAGIVEVKTRGRAVDPDKVQAALRGDGATPYTLFVLRFDRRVEALIARRVSS